MPIEFLEVRGMEDHEKKASFTLYSRLSKTHAILLYWKN